MFGIRNYSSDTHRDFNISFAIDREDSQPFKTVIIGDNASGKTRFIVSLIEMFRLIYEVKEDGSSKKISSAIKELVSRQGDIKFGYDCGGSFFKVLLNKDGLKFTENGKFCEAANLSLPARVIAISTTYNDKFPFADNDNDTFYKYCGIRETSNASWTATLTRKTIDNLLKIPTLNVQSPIKTLFKYLDLDTSFRVSFRIMKPQLFKDAIRSPLDLLNMIHRYSNKNSRMQVGMFREASYEDGARMFAALEFLHLKGSVGYFDVDLLSDGRGHDSIQDLINMLRRIGLIHEIELNLYKRHDNSTYSFSNASSGETQMLFAFSSVLRYAADESVIFIDEPEVSLHPNWQIRYVSLLKKALATIKNCHVIIASHSHFIVSDLDQKNSSLHVFKKNSGGDVDIDNISHSTYAWSPENILYSVFNVRTVGNPGFEKDLERALSLISAEKSDINELKFLANKFSQIVFDSSDPLANVVESIMDYIDVHQ